MKKRRQLDALVGNGKTRRKSKSGHELLRSNADTDSSDLDQFSVDSDNSRLRKHRNPNFCSICMTVIGFCLLAACIIACAGLIWMHLQLKRDIAALQDEMKSVESKNKVCSEENQKITSELQGFNKTLQELKTQNVTNGNNITKLKTEIVGLQSTVSKIQKNIASGTELEDFPAKLTALTSTVAKIGSDFSTTQKQLEQEIEELNLKLKKVEMSQSTTPIPSTTSSLPIMPGVSPIEVTSLNDTIQKIDVTVQALNKSLSLGLETNKEKIQETERNIKNIMKIMTDLNKLSGGSAGSVVNTTILENNLKNELQDWLQKMLDNETKHITEPSTLPSDIHSRIDNATEAIESLWNEINELRKGSNVTHSPEVNLDEYLKIVEFQTFNTKVTMEIQQINETTGHLKQDLSALQRGFKSSKAELLNVTRKVTKIAEYLTKNTSESQDTDRNKVSVGPKITPQTTPPATKRNQTTAKLSDELASSTLKIPGISNIDELKDRFKVWDFSEEGKVSYEDISNDFEISETALSKFDTDNDQLYSLKELQNALGFNPSTESPPIRKNK